MQDPHVLQSGISKERWPESTWQADKTWTQLIHKSQIQRKPCTSVGTRLMHSLVPIICHCWNGGESICKKAAGLGQDTRDRGSNSRLNPAVIDKSDVVSQVSSS
jgi:hypothetical protein